MKVEEEQLDINYDASLAQILSDLAGDKLKKVRPQNFGITTQEFAVLKKTTVERARSFLNDQVKEGMLKCRKMSIPGKPGSCPYVYYQPEGDE